jgi:hypothetical protein
MTPLVGLDRLEICTSILSEKPESVPCLLSSLPSSGLPARPSAVSWKACETLLSEMRFDQSPLFSSKVNVSAGGKVIVRLIPALAAGQMELAGIFLS